MKKLSTKEFIDKASIKHNGRYGYDFVNYVNSQTPVIITCPIHGNFEQKPAKHLLGQGCPECNGTKRKTIKEFVQQARQIHGDNYLRTYCKENSIRLIEISYEEKDIIGYLKSKL